MRQRAQRLCRRLLVCGLHLACLGGLALGLKPAARRLLERLLALNPEDARALASRAHLRAEAGDLGGAIDDYRRLLARQPASGAAHWFNLGYLLEADGCLDEAEASFRRALALDERLDRAWYGLGRVLGMRGRHDEAIEALRRNVELQPMSPHGREQLVRLHLLRHEREAAQELLRQLRAFEPGVARRLERETGLQA